MYKIGDIVEGVVTGLQPYGAFINLEEATGLVHISEVSDGFVRHIEDFLELGKKYSFYVIDIDDKTNHVKLSYKKIHSETKRERTISRNAKQLNKNSNLFEDTYNVVEECIKELDTEHLIINYHSNIINDIGDKDINNFDFVKYPETIMEKDVLRIQSITNSLDINKLVIVSNDKHFYLFDAYIDFLGLKKDKLIYCNNTASVAYISDLIKSLKKSKYAVLFILDDIYTENIATIYRLFRKDFAANGLEWNKYIFISCLEEDADICSLVNKENYEAFIETSIDPKYSICLPSSLFVLSYLGVDPFKILQGYRLGMISHNETKDYLSIISRTQEGTLNARYSSLFKLLNYYNSDIDLSIDFDVKKEDLEQLPKYKDGLKKLKGKEGKYIQDDILSSTTIYLKDKDEFTLTYLLSLIYLIIAIKN